MVQQRPQGAQVFILKGSDGKKKIETHKELETVLGTVSILKVTPSLEGFREGRFHLKQEAEFTSEQALKACLKLGTLRLALTNSNVLLVKESGAQGSRASEFSIHFQGKLGQSQCFFIFYSNCHLVPSTPSNTLNQSSCLLFSKSSIFSSQEKGAVICCSVAQLCLTLRPHGLQHVRLSCPLPSPAVCSDSRALSQ